MFSIYEYSRKRLHFLKESPIPTDQAVIRDYDGAYRHWLDRSADLEHQGKLADLPSLANSKNFRNFRHEYSVFRRNRLNVVECVRLHLLGDGILETAISNAHAFGIELLAIDLQRHCGVTNREVSAISKIIALIHPEKFNPMDKFAKNGITEIPKSELADKFITKRAASCYAEYCLQIDHILESNYFKSISEELQKEPLPGNASREAFNRRILDVHLMRVGGRTYKRQ
jgi:hypothetical protein